MYKRIATSTIDTYTRSFQYKLLNNILYTNKDLYRFKIKESPRCSFCFTHLETVEHIFVTCPESKNLYFRIVNWLNNFGIHLPEQKYLCYSAIQHLQTSINEPYYISQVIIYHLGTNNLSTDDDKTIKYKINQISSLASKKYPLLPSVYLKFLNGRAHQMKECRI